MPISTQQRSIYEYALKHLEAERTRLDNHIAEVHQQLGTKAKTSAQAETVSEPAPSAPETKRKMSASARKRIAAAQKLRWKLFHAKGKTAAEAPAEPVTKKAAGKKAKTTTAKKATKKAAKMTGKKRDNSDIPF